MEKVCSPYFDPDFDNMLERINGPSCRVCIDNDSLTDSTLIKVDRVNKQDLLLETVQVIADLNISITKGFISSDGGWFMDVFHVKDEHGNKLTDPTILNIIQHGIGSKRAKSSSRPPKVTGSTSKSVGSEHIVLEMTAADRPGLFSEISAALTDLHCNIVEAHVWTHNALLACVIYISDPLTTTSIHDPLRLASIQKHLTTVLKAKSSQDEIEMRQLEVVKTSDCIDEEEGMMMMTNIERRLHQLMVSGRDFEMPHSEPSTSPRSPLDCKGDDEARMKATVCIETCYQRSYSIVSVECRDHPRVIFDALCTLIDMEYVIFHAYIIRTSEGFAFQEYFIRHKDGTLLRTESEKDRVIKGLEAAIERRVCEGIKLELCANNRVGLLSDITRLLRENGLAVVRADIATQGEKAVDAFYVRDLSGKDIDMKFLESFKSAMSPIHLQVKNESMPRLSSPKRYRFSLRDMLKSHITQFSHSLLP